ncbi:ankyrin and armadillo repeat-containing protein-like [Clytia hemisphaerica]|uniref:ankyrin and armadillo repeat-containing protein-like n=1 Tax=Clytia hemisphaerica TaxID=252671 RepID=UPI0034D73D0A
MMAGSSNSGVEKATNDKFELEEHDDKGWTPLHYAAYEGFFKTVNRLVENKPSRLEVKTQDEMKVTPLWLAFAEGHIETVGVLLMYNTDITVVDVDENDIIDIAFINHQNKLLLYIINNNYEHLYEMVWQRLFEYISTDNLNENLKMVSLQIFVEMTSKSSGCDKENVDTLFKQTIQLYKAELVEDKPEMELMLTQLIEKTLIKNEQETYTVLSKANIIDILAERLENLKEREISTTILTILKCCQRFAEDFSNKMRERNNFFRIIKFMEMTTDEYFLISSFEIILKSLKGNETMQSFFDQNNRLLNIVVDTLKKTENQELQIVSLKTLRFYIYESSSIQMKLISIKIFDILQPCMHTKGTLKEVCKVIYTSTLKNKQLQLYFMESGSIAELLKQMKKMKKDESQEWIMRALWSIAGGEHRQTMIVAKSLPMQYIVNLTTSNSSTVLQYYGGEFFNVLLRMASYTLSDEVGSNIFLHLLNSSLKSFLMADEMLTSALKTMQKLCIRSANIPNKTIQKIALEKNSINIILQVAIKSEKPVIELEVYQTIACLLFENKDGIRIMKKFGSFPPSAVMRYLSHTQPSIRFKACEILTQFLLDKEYKAIRNFKLPIHFFNNIEDSKMKVDSAFQMIVLKDHILNTSPTYTIMEGLQLLFDLLHHQDGDIMATAADHVASISLYCHGMRAAFTEANFLDILCSLMENEDDMVKTASAVAIASIAKYFKAEIVLLKICRQQRGLFDEIESWSKLTKLPAHFVERWKHCSSLNTAK